MKASIVPSTLYSSSFAGFVSSPSWMPAGGKDLSAGGACETGYGDKTKIHSSLQYLTNLKHSEKHTPYIRWAVTVVPVLLDVLPKIAYHNEKRTPLAEIPGRTLTVLKEKIGNVSAKQLGFLLSIIPLYHNTRALKNHVFPGNGFDPSGHTMFKIAQYGMMYSITTEHGTQPRINNLTVGYIAFTAIADAVMLSNTIVNCHTLAEIAVGGCMGIAILFAARFISTHTPLGEYAQSVAKVAGKVVSRVSSTLINGVRGGFSALAYANKAISYA